MPGNAADADVARSAHEIEKRQGESRLAGARLADHAERFAGREIEIRVLYRDEASLGEPAANARQLRRVFHRHATRLEYAAFAH